MKKAFKYLFIIIMLFSSCKSSYEDSFSLDNRRRDKWFEPTPFGMAYVERGSYNLGSNDDELYELSPARTVSVESFWIDDTEITNSEYKQFVYWVRDKKARELLSQTFSDFLITEDANGNALDEPELNYDEPIEWKNPEYQAALEELYLPDNERFGYKKEIDPRKLIYDYYWVDYKQAAQRSNSFNYKTQKYEGTVLDREGNIVPIKNRRSFLMHEQVPAYPDTLCWIRDFTYSYNEPFTLKYFSHQGFDDYPVVGVTWDQAKAFCHWRTYLRGRIIIKRFKETPAHDFRLPTEAEWEIASRGGNSNCLYPWGSYYTRNIQGCFVANFKPLRGNYVADSPTTTKTMKVGSFDPNPYGVYDMAGNVAEWTSTAFFEAGYNIIDDYNPEIQYDARPDEPAVMKRKVIRGGSWKDIAYFIQSSIRSYEYQDSSKSYVGFRCVRTSFRKDLNQYNP